MDRRQSGLVGLRGGVSEEAAPLGKVWLVGAGPGDPELLTLKAARLLAVADVVVHDRLVAPEILDLVPSTARRLYVGKQKARHALPQDDINALLVGLAKDGLNVVRLKGGDPFVFGRGGEEMLACRAAGIACEVVPGISAALAASAAAGAPLTHRGLAQSVTFATGHAAAGTGEPDLDWAALAKANHTVALYMALSTAPVIAGRLMEAGRAVSTPVAVLENASLPNERRMVTTLAGLADVAVELSGPALLIIGEVAALACIEGTASFETPAAQAPHDDELGELQNGRHGEERSVRIASRTTQRERYK